MIWCRSFAIGGRPTRRMVANCCGVESGISEFATRLQSHLRRCPGPRDVDLRAAYPGEPIRVRRCHWIGASRSDARAARSQIACVTSSRPCIRSYGACVTITNPVRHHYEAHALLSFSCVHVSAYVHGLCTTSLNGDARGPNVVHRIGDRDARDPRMSCTDARM
jgi:hypothetical protein